MVEMAFISGLIERLIRPNTSMGSVVPPGPVTKNVMTKLSSDKVKANKPDLMTLDMVMPRHSGITLMRKLRQNKEWSDIPVIVITAHAQDEFGSEDAKKFEAFAAHHRPKYFM